MTRRITAVLNEPRLLMARILDLGVFNIVPDYIYLKMRYRLLMGKELNLANPRYFNEKLQWLKLHNRNPLHTGLVDKYEVRKFVAKTVGEEYLVPLIGVWDKFEDIDMDALPNQFVLKCTHDSGGVVICRDKSVFDIEAARRKLNKCLARNYYYPLREWPYRDVKPRVICEKLITTADGGLPNDYKFHCFNGEPDNVMVCLGRASGRPKYYYFDNEWKLLRYNLNGMNPTEDLVLPKPKKLDEMFEISGALARGFPYVRVDLYHENERVYFGELTFYPQGGFDSQLLEETDLLFGSKLELRPEN